MKPNRSKNYFLPRQPNGRDRVLMGHPMHPPFQVHPSRNRNEYERYWNDLGGEASYVTPRDYAAEADYFPPGTHSVPSRFHEVEEHIRSQGQFLPPLRSRGQLGSYYPRDQLERLFLEEESRFGHLPPISISDPHGAQFLDAYPNNDCNGYLNHFQDQQDLLLEEDKDSLDNFQERLEHFPHLPMDAHKRIFQMGNQIVDVFDVHLERFFRGSMLDSAKKCLAVFTKKERTGQRWLMVFMDDMNRSVIKFNRLLTHSLLVRVQSATAIEIEAAKAFFGPPAEMCVLNFRNGEEAMRFNVTLQESQRTAWNHREVTQEQRMKNLLTRINNPAPGSEVMMIPHPPPPRSPFTLSSLRSPPPGSPTNNISDLDNDWRHRQSTHFRDMECYLPESPIPKKNHTKDSRGCGDFVYNSMTHTDAMRMDGSGDADTPYLESAVNEVAGVKEILSFESNDISLFVKSSDCQQGYEPVGTGRLEVVDHGKCALDEIKFRKGKGVQEEELYSQFIFRWNTISKGDSGSEEEEVSCRWNGAASLTSSPNEIPETRDFKVRFKDSETADRFLGIFRKGVERGCDPVIKKRHVAWFIKNRGHSFYK